MFFSYFLVYAYISKNSNQKAKWLLNCRIATKVSEIHTSDLFNWASNLKEGGSPKSGAMKYGTSLGRGYAPSPQKIFFSKMPPPPQGFSPPFENLA